MDNDLKIFTVNFDFKLMRSIFYLTIFCMAAIGCTKENPPKVLQLSLDQNNLTVDAPAGSASVNIRSNTIWNVTSSVNWLTISPSSGTGNSVLTVNYAAMTNMDQRTGSFTVLAGNLQQKVNVSQDQRIKLMQVQGILGNLETGINATVMLTFNSPVSVRNIWDKMYPSINTLVENFSVTGNQVTFTYGNIMLGDEYPFTIDLENGYSFSFKVSFHKTKLNISGNVVDYFITDNNTSIWAITQSPNQLINLSLPDLNPLKTLPLSFIPEKVRWNNYHGNLLIFYPSAYDSTFIYVDPASLAITKVHVEAYKDVTESWFGVQYASDMCQMKDGSGIMQTKVFSGPYGWRYINKTDSTWLTPSAYSPSPPIGYDEIFTNYDQSKIFLLYPNGDTRVDVWQMGTDSVKTIYPPNITYVNAGAFYISVNKKQDLILHVHGLAQYISDLSGNISSISYLSNIFHKFNSAFSYRSGEDQTVYFIADDSFNVLDYKNGYTNLSAGVNPNFYRPQSTTDGKYITALLGNGFTTDLCVYDLNSILVNATKSGSSSGGRIKSPPAPSVWIKK